MRYWNMRKIYLAFLAGIVLVLPYGHVSALALSDIQLHSSLNQILDARVLLLAVDRDELGSLQIDINENTEIAAVQGNVKLKPAIKENENGYYIEITSEDVIKEPVLRFSLELNWSKGHLIREYSLLIDPR